MKKIYLLLTTIIFLASCQKDDVNLKSELDLKGNDILNVEEFEVILNEKDLKSNESGFWSIQSGLIDEKVFFDDIQKPQTTFHGLPGEEYKLIWKLTSSGVTTTTTVTVSFRPLKTEIVNLSLGFYKTRLHLQAKYYDKGQWTIEGRYNNIVDRFLSNKPITSIQSPDILFYGFDNTAYKLTWTTWYGSKSASATILFNSGEYHQDEALEDLSARSYQFKKDSNGNVIELNMNGSRSAWIYQYPDQFPSLQSLIYLKKLLLSGDGITDFPQVISSKYLNLEFLNIGHNAISSIPENFGSLTKLDTLILNNNNYNKTLTKLPESFGQLKNLRYLDLVMMGLETLPDSFSNLKNLKHCDLSLNVIAKLPENIGNLSNLENFRTTVAASIPSSFSNLTNLKECYLVISNNSTTILPEDFGNLKKLRTLYLVGDFTKLPSSFSNLSSLVNLELMGASHLQELPDNFGNLANLENATIHGNFKVLPNSFTNLKKLKELTITSSLESLPANIGNLNELRWLSVNSMNLKEIPDSFGNLENLKYFRAYLNKISYIPASFGNLKNIYEVNLSYNSITHFPSTIANLSDTLYELIIRGNNYSQEELNALKKMLPNSKITYE